MKKLFLSLAVLVLIFSFGCSEQPTEIVKQPNIQELDSGSGDVTIYERTYLAAPSNEASIIDTITCPFGYSQCTVFIDTHPFTLPQPTWMVSMAVQVDRWDEEIGSNYWTNSGFYSPDSDYYIVDGTSEDEFYIQYWTWWAGDSYNNNSGWMHVKITARDEYPNP